MARINSGGKMTWIILAVLGGFLLLSGVVAFVLLRKPNEFASLPPFPLDSYMDGKSLWSHEEYRMEGRVDNVIVGSPGGGRMLVSIQPKGSDLRLPVLLDREGGKVPIQREQQLVLKVRLGASSRIECRRYEPK